MSKVNIEFNIDADKAIIEVQRAQIGMLELEVERLKNALADANAKLGNLSDTFRRLPPITQELVDDYTVFGKIADTIMKQEIDSAFCADVDANDKELRQ